MPAVKWSLVRPILCYVTWSAICLSKKNSICIYHVIGYCDLVDLWVIKIKRLWSFACLVCRDHVNSTKRRSHSKNLWKVCWFCSQNNKIVWLSNMADTFFFERFTRCAMVFGLFFVLDATIGWEGKVKRGPGSQTKPTEPFYEKGRCSKRYTAELNA